MNDNIDAQVYTITEAYSMAGTRNIMVKLMYVSEFGKRCDAGTVDASLLMTPLTSS